MRQIGVSLTPNILSHIHRVRLTVALDYYFEFKPKITSIIEVLIEMALNHEPPDNLSEFRSLRKDLRNSKRYNIFLEDKRYIDMMRLGYERNMSSIQDIAFCMICYGLQVQSGGTLNLLSDKDASK